MRFRISVISLLYVTVVLFVLFLVTGGLLFVNKLNKSKKIISLDYQIYNPILSEIKELHTNIGEIKLIAENLSQSEDYDQALNINKLYNDITKKIPSNVVELNNTTKTWSNEGRTISEAIKKIVTDTLSAKVEALIDIWDITNSNTTEQQNIAKENTSIYASKALEQLKELLKNIEKSRDDNIRTLNKTMNNLQNNILTILIILAVISLLMLYFARKSILGPLLILRENLLKMKKGDISEKKPQDYNNEFGDIFQCVNDINEGLRQTVNFVTEIGHGNLNADYTTFGSDDILGHSLINMRDNLEQSNIENQSRKKEEETRNWTTRGQARLGEVLRQNISIEKLAYEVIDSIIDYVGAVQGAIYLIDETIPEDIHFKMVAAVAYGRHKLANRRIEMEEGLVGRCYFEKDIIYIKQVPENYVRITTGLGDTPPTVLLLVPLLSKNQMFGTIELAKFEEFEEYQIDFMKKIGEDIAGTIATIVINEKTAKLLEDSQKKWKELSMREEAVRRNMEDLHISQETSAQRERQLSETLNAIKSSTGQMELDMSGKITNVNEIISKILNIKANETIGRDLRNIIAIQLQQEEKYKKMWDDFTSGISAEMDLCYISVFGDIWLRESFIPIKNIHGIYDKVIALVVDITDNIAKDKAIHAYKREIEEQGDMLFQAIKQINQLKEQFKIRENELMKENEALEKEYNVQIENMRTQIDDLEDRLKTILGTSIEK